MPYIGTARPESSHGDIRMRLCVNVHQKLSCELAGVIICEGAEEDAAEFVHRLRQLRWKVGSVPPDVTTDV